MTEAQREFIRAIAKRVRFLMPNRHRPDEFHIEKDAISKALLDFARNPEAQG